MKYVITKEVEAKNIKEAIAKEAKGEIVDVQKKEEEPQPPKMGYSI